MVEFVDRKNNPTKRPASSPAPAMNKNDLEVKCRHCSRSFSVLSALAGQEATCPGCGKGTPVNAPAATAKPDPKLPEQRTANLKAPKKKTQPQQPPPTEKSTESKAPAKAKPAADKSPLKTKPKCPECGGTMEADAVICVKCGFDSRKGAVRTTEVKTKSKGPLALVLFLAIALGGGAAYYFLVMKKSTEDVTSQPTSTAPTREAPRAVPEPTPIPEPADTPSAPEVLSQPTDTPAAEPSPETQPVVDVTPEPEPMPDPALVPDPEPEPVEVAQAEPDVNETEADPRAEIRANIADRLATKQPTAAPGDSVVLTAKDGKTYRGKILAMNSSSLRLYYNGSEIELPVDTLSTRSRSKVDPAFREELIDLLVQKVIERQAQ